MTVVVVLSVLGVAMLVVAGVAGFRIQRSVRRRIVTTRARIAAVQAKAQARIQPPGPRRDAAQLRQRLQAEMRSTKEMLGTAPDGLIFRASATTVLAELTAEASALDAQLAAVD